MHTEQYQNLCWVACLLCSFDSFRAALLFIATDVTLYLAVSEGSHLGGVGQGTTRLPELLLHQVLNKHCLQLKILNENVIACLKNAMITYLQWALMSSQTFVCWNKPEAAASNLPSCPRLSHSFYISTFSKWTCLFLTLRSLSISCHSSRLSESYTAFMHRDFTLTL